VVTLLELHANQVVPAERLALAPSLWRRPAPADFRCETVAQAEIARLDKLRLIGEQPLRALRSTSPVCRPRPALTPGRRMIAATERDHSRNLRAHHVGRAMAAQLPGAGRLI
jgi:hypothetical protein